jgi:hypothetical protein
MRPKGERIFRTRTSSDYLSEDDGFVGPYIEPIPYQRFKMVQGYKFYKGDEEIWVNEEKLIERYKCRKPITRRELFEKFQIKYETVFNRLCVTFNKRDKFWKILEKDLRDDVFDTCFEVRLDEIVCKCTDINRKYWKTQKTISARKRRTQLFSSDIFQKRKSCWKCNYIGVDNFKNKVLDDVRRKIIRNLGNRFEGKEWEEMLLYAMASTAIYLVHL